MVLVFIICAILIAITLLVIFSTISIQIEQFKMSNCNINSKLKFDYKVHVKLIFLDRLKIFSNKIDKQKVEKLNTKFNFKNKLQNINIKQMQNEISKDEAKELIKKLQIDIPKINLKVEIGTEDIIATVAIILAISTGLGIVFAKFIKQYENKKHKFEIYPIYEDKNLVKIDLNCIIKVKIVHIIFIVYVLLKKRRVDKNERTSNRRSYDYSYE